MKGIKMVLLGIAIILIGGFILVDTESYLGGVGEVVIFAIGLIICIKGVKIED